jgi:hypothetical protein
MLSFHQDRLGKNTGKVVLKKETRFRFSQAVNAETSTLTLLEPIVQGLDLPRFGEATAEKVTENRVENIGIEGIRVVRNKTEPFLSHFKLNKC